MNNTSRKCEGNTGDLWTSVINYKIVINRNKLQILMQKSSLIVKNNAMFGNVTIHHYKREY